MTKIKDKIILRSNKIPNELKVGMVFEHSGDIYILACVTYTIDSSGYNLISLNGRRWSDPTTLEKIKAVIRSENFNYVENAEITVKGEIINISRNIW